MNFVNSDLEPNLPSHPNIVQLHGPVDKLDSQTRGVPNDIESEIKALNSNSEGLALDDGIGEFITTVDDDSIPEIVNNEFRLPISIDGRATGTVIEDDGIIYV